MALVGLLQPGCEGAEPRQQPTVSQWGPIQGVGKADSPNDPRRELPDVYGVTDPPPEPVRLPGEFEPAERLFVSWVGDDLTNTVAEIVKAASQAVDVTVFPGGWGAYSLKDDLKAAGLEGVVQIFEYDGLQASWIRDFGPLVVQSVEGLQRYAVDLRYGSPEQLAEDALPTKTAKDFGWKVVRPNLIAEGGNLLSDGQGRCIATTRLLTENPGQTEAEIRTLLGRFFGCTTTVLVKPLHGEATEHVDLFAIITGPATAMVGRYAPSYDAENAARLDEAAAKMEAAGFRVRRIGLPPHTRRAADATQKLFRTYTNAIALNEVVLVPVYQDSTATQAAALQAFAEEYPERTIVPIESSHAIEFGGSVHCLTMSVAR